MTADCNPAGERDAVCEQTTVFHEHLCTVYHYLGWYETAKQSHWLVKDVKTIIYRLVNDVKIFILVSYVALIKTISKLQLQSTI